MNIHEQEPDEVMFAGDWHAYTDQATRVVASAHQAGIKHIIQAGDFGIWRDRHSVKFVKNLNAFAGQYGVHIYFVDGNHEDHPFLRQFPQNEDGTLRVQEHISYLPRGFRWEWNTVRYMAMGGAYSVDRQWRDIGYSWFPEEEISDDEVKQAIQDPTPVDVLISHDSPTGAPNPVTDDPYTQAVGIRNFGEYAIQQAELHRNQLLRVTNVVDPVLIIHGHYHKPGQKQYRRPATGTLCDVVSLDEGSAQLHNHTITITLSELLLIKQDNRVDTTPAD